MTAQFYSILCIYYITRQHQLSISRHLDIKVSGVYRCLNAMIKHWIPESCMGLVLQNSIWAYISEKTTHTDQAIISKSTNKQHTVSYTTSNIFYYKINQKLYAKELYAATNSLLLVIKAGCPSLWFRTHTAEIVFIYGQTTFKIHLSDHISNTWEYSELAFKFNKRKLAKRFRNKCTSESGKEMKCWASRVLFTGLQDEIIIRY